MMTMPPVVTPDQRQGREAACREIVRDVEHGMTVTHARRRCSPDACAPMAIATPKPFYHSSLVPMERSASPMPSPPGPPTSGIRPRTQEEPNIPPRLLALLMDIVNPCTVKS